MKNHANSYAVTTTEKAKAESRVFAKTPKGQDQLASVKAEVVKIRAGQAERMSMAESQKDVQTQKQQR